VSELQTTVRFRIHDGKLDEFKGLVDQCVQITRERDAGTLQYDWFLSADGKECVLRDRYRDSAAVLEHAGNLGELMGRFFSISDPEVEFFGAPSAELLGALAMLQPRVYSAFQSL